MNQAALPDSLPLFPLQSVLLPDGLLALKVFEARYLDLISECMRLGQPFGVVALRRGSEVRREGEAVEFESVGCAAHVLDVDSEQPGILQVRCRGGERFRVLGSELGANGVWRARAEVLDPDEPSHPTADLVGSAEALAQAIEALDRQGRKPFLAPYRFQEAGWIANRWCEILPIPVAARQKLMELPDPLVRLEIVDRFLRQNGILPAA